jgi:outer membrane protein assembly factor BamB
VIRWLFRWLLRVVAALVVVGGALYLFGYRLVPYGGGLPRLQRIGSADERAAEVERHRQSQRAAAPAAAPGAPSTPVATIASALIPTNAPWPEFRGPRRDGRYTGDIRTDWPAEGLRPIWKQPVGGGYASFAVAGGRAFTIEQRRAEEVVAAYDVATGRELWTHGWPALFSETLGGDGPRATPTWHDGRIYALGATGELRCLDAGTGAQVWRTDILDDAGAENLSWGMSASPLVVKDTVIVLPGGPKGRSIVAYDRLTGQRRWSALDDRQAYTSPMLVTLAGTPQLLVASGTRVMGLDPDRGALLWSSPWQTMQDINAAQPLVVGANRVFFSSGYGVGAAVFEIADGSPWSVREVWRNVRMKNRFGSAVLHDGFIYGFDEAIFACIDAATGDLKWKGGRYGYGQVVVAGDRLIVLSEEGDLVLLNATPVRHDELARFPAITGKTWNHPAIADGILLVRNATEMAAFDLRR